MMSPESLAAADGNIVRWFEQDFGGEVVELARQPRWRPVWFATVDRGDTRHELVVRGDRTDMPLIFPLRHEMTFQRLLGESGIPVAKVHGWIDEPMAFVIDRVGGREHFGDTSEDRAGPRPSTTTWPSWPGSMRSRSRRSPRPGIRRASDPSAGRAGGAAPLRGALPSAEEAPGPVPGVLPGLAAPQPDRHRRAGGAGGVGLGPVPPRRRQDRSRARPGAGPSSATR